MEDRAQIRQAVLEVFSKYNSSTEEPRADDPIEAAFLSVSGSSTYFARARARARTFRLIEEVQLRFGIYFSQEDLASQLSFDSLTDLIQSKLKKNKAGALRSVRYHAGGGEGTNQLIFLNVVLALPVVYLGKQSFTHACVFGVIALLLNGLLASVHIRGHFYNKKLISRIQQRP
ncbi:MAG: hypothetical protein PVJ98_06955 [Akkermansiaceae bacterium]|jgi:hypothetical protein